jgi:disulfide oxidoreductase YuzD
MKIKKNKNFWLDEPEEHNFPAAQDYLELLYTTERSKIFVNRLKNEKTVVKKAKDILRASRLPLLKKSNIHVKNNIKKVKCGELLSPVLLIRNDNRLIIADGYHRICAIYYLSEDLDIPCRIT